MPQAAAGANYISNTNKAAVKVSGTKSTDTTQIVIDIDDEDTFASPKTTTLSGLGTGTTYADATGIDVTTATALADGNLAIRITASDAAGNTATQTVLTGAATFKKDIGVPTTPSVPDLAAADDTGSSNTDNITSQTTALTFTGTAEVNSSVQLYDGASTAGSPATATDGSWSIDLSLAEGAHSITAKATDAAGNTSSDSTALSVTVDTTAPAFTIAYYTDTNLTTALTNNYMKAGAYYLKITSNGTSAAPTISIAAEGTANDVTGAATTLVSGNDYKYTRTIIADAAAIGSVAEAITITGTDTAGNTATNADVTGEKYTDTIAPTAPAIGSFAATGGTITANYINNTNTGFTVSFTSPDANFSGTAHLYLAGADFTTPITTTVSAAATVYTLTGNAQSITDLGADASKSLTVVIVDTAGNVSVASSAVSIIKDTASPTAATTYSDADGLVKADDSLIITATFNENMADAPISKVALSGANTLAAINMTKSSATVYTYTHTVGAGDGTATVALSIGTDVAGNVVTSAPTSGATFTVDNTAPTAPAIGSFAATGGTITANYINNTNTGFTVSFTSPDANFSGTAHLYLAGADFTTPITTTVSAAATVYTLTGNAQSITDLGADASKSFNRSHCRYCGQCLGCLQRSEYY